MRQNLLYTFLLFFSLLFVVQPVEAKKKQKNKYELKRENASNLPLIEPDPITYKAKPDSKLRIAEQPRLMGGGRGYRVGNWVHGIDVSHYQGRIEWRTVASNPEVGYVFLKASEGGNITDETYEYNLREARRAGLKVGSYHFFRANTSAELQFRNFMSMVKVKSQDLLPIIDVEVTNGVSESTFHARLEQLLKLVTQEFGRKPIIYTGKNFYNKHFHGGRYRDYKFMIACYTIDEPLLNGNDDFVMWQYSQTGRVRGIRGNVDQSRFVGRHTLREIQF